MITLKVVRTKTAWRIQSAHDISRWAGSQVEGLKVETVNRANKLASNLSKKDGVQVTVEVYSAKGKPQSSATW